MIKKSWFNYVFLYVCSIFPLIQAISDSDNENVKKNKFATIIAKAKTLPKKTLYGAVGTIVVGAAGAIYGIREVFFNKHAKLNALELTHKISDLFVKNKAFNFSELLNNNSKALDFLDKDQKVIFSIDSRKGKEINKNKNFQPLILKDQTITAGEYFLCFDDRLIYIKKNALFEIAEIKTGSSYILKEAAILQPASKPLKEKIKQPFVESWKEFVEGAIKQKEACCGWGLEQSAKAQEYIISSASSVSNKIIEYADNNPTAAKVVGSVAAVGVVGTGLYYGSGHKTAIASAIAAGYATRKKSKAEILGAVVAGGLTGHFLSTPTQFIANTALNHSGKVFLAGAAATSFYLLKDSVLPMPALKSGYDGLKTVASPVCCGIKGTAMLAFNNPKKTILVVGASVLVGAHATEYINAYAAAETIKTMAIANKEALESAVKNKELVGGVIATGSGIGSGIAHKAGYNKTRNVLGVIGLSALGSTGYNNGAALNKMADYAGSASTKGFNDAGQMIQNFVSDNKEVVGGVILGGALNGIKTFKDNHPLQRNLVTAEADLVTAEADLVTAEADLVTAEADLVTAEAMGAGRTAIRAARARARAARARAARARAARDTARDTAYEAATAIRSLKVSVIKGAVAGAAIGSIGHFLSTTTQFMANAGPALVGSGLEQIGTFAKNHIPAEVGVVGGAIHGMMHTCTTLATAERTLDNAETALANAETALDNAERTLAAAETALTAAPTAITAIAAAAETRRRDAAKTARNAAKVARNAAKVARRNEIFFGVGCKALAGGIAGGLTGRFLSTSTQFIANAGHALVGSGLEQARTFVGNHITADAGVVGGAITGGFGAGKLARTKGIGWTMTGAAALSGALGGAVVGGAVGEGLAYAGPALVGQLPSL